MSMSKLEFMTDAEFRQRHPGAVIRRFDPKTAMAEEIAQVAADAAAIRAFSVNVPESGE